MVKYSQNQEFTGGSKGMVQERELFSKTINKKKPGSIQAPSIKTKVNPLGPTRTFSVLTWVKLQVGITNDLIIANIFFIYDLLKKYELLIDSEELMTNFFISKKGFMIDNKIVDDYIYGYNFT